MAQGRFCKAASTLAFGYFAEHALLFLRTVLVARLLGPDNFGVSVTFVLVVSSFALISDLGFEKYLIHARDAELERARQTLATLLLARGVLLGVAIALGAGWIASAFGQPDLAWFYACAGFIPVIEGFRHLSPLEQQRKMHFGPFIRMRLGGLIPGVVTAIAVAAITGSYVAVAAGSLATSTITVVLSHLLADHRWRIGFDREAFRHVMAYGWPLLLNGVVIFLGVQGDRIVVGTQAGMRELAGYAAVGALTAGLSTFLARLCGNLSFPLMSEARDDPTLFAERSRTTGAATLLVLSLFVLPVGVLGGPIAALLFGPGYVTEPLLATFLAVLASSVVLRSWCVVISLTLGVTSDILLASILRTGGLAIAFWAINSGHSVVWVAAGMCAGDVSATFYALWRAGRRSVSAASACRFSGLVFAGQAALVIVIVGLFDPYASWTFSAVLAAAVSLPGTVFALLMSADLRRRLALIARQLHSRLRRKEAR
ncbi:colanic acid exporter [Tsuneonella dongtanensis]|uniref:Colanic acid exporter n=1 Tax=Tsuneonella dongtanensis TaxID=692370 RepID=A0A1B2AB81_9SPHN|nr:oligosaccharide flippase family protein [Tsuneonella dongtanensis]ANY19419.1 colanic acid exporter [Tsuneonella dongtanensis]